MSKQIIYTKGNTGMELEVSFIDKLTKSNFNLSGYTVEVDIINPNNEVVDVVKGYIKDLVNGIVSIIITDDYTSQVGLYKTCWRITDSNENVNTQQDVFYYVKDGVNREYSKSELELDSVRDKLKEIDEEQIIQNTRLDEVEKTSLINVEDISEVRVEITNIKTDIQTNITNINNNKSDIATLQSENVTNKSNIKTNTENIKETAKKLDELILNNESAVVVTEVMDARQGHSKLVDNIQSIKNNISNSDILINNNKTQIVNINKDINTLTSSTSSNANDIFSLKTKTNQIEGNVSKLDRDKLNSSAYTPSDVLNKIKTVDGGNSGLDADMLDGKHANDFVLLRALGEFGRECTYVSDMSRALDNGFYRFDTKTSGKPGGTSYGVFLHLKWDIYDWYQILLDVHCKLFVRSYVNGNFSSWVEK